MDASRCWPRRMVFGDTNPVREAVSAPGEKTIPPPFFGRGRALQLPEIIGHIITASTEIPDIEDWKATELVS